MQRLPGLTATDATPQRPNYIARLRMAVRDQRLPYSTGVLNRLYPPSRSSAEDLDWYGLNSRKQKNRECNVGISKNNEYVKFAKKCFYVAIICKFVI